MILDNIEKLCDAGKYEEADRLIEPKQRKINKSLNFKSSLMLSANNTKHLKKISKIEADCIILNLEDGVSKEQKPKALRLCAYVLSTMLTCKKKLVVRVNALDEGGEDEIRYLSAFMPDAFRVPKIRTREDVRKALNLIGCDSELHLSIETKESWLNLKDLRIDSRVSAFYLGVLDLFADLELSHSLIVPKNPTISYILTHFMLTCKAIGVKPVSFVFQEYKDMDTFLKWLKVEKEIGYDSKACISPSQAIEVSRVFGYSQKEIEDAKNIVALFEAKLKEGISGFSDERYGFIDEPIYKGAKVIIS